MFEVHHPGECQTDGTKRMGIKPGPRPLPASLQLGTNKGAAVTPLLTGRHLCKTSAALSGRLLPEVEQCRAKSIPWLCLPQNLSSSQEELLCSLCSVAQSSTVELTASGRGERSVRCCCRKDPSRTPSSIQHLHGHHHLTSPAGDVRTSPGVPTCLQSSASHLSFC